jgi:glycosyltransferase involved in cell wall biosynthesis
MNSLGIRASIVVPTYRRPDLLERCLAALVDQDFDPHRFEIIVADDGDDPRTRTLVQRWTRRTAGAPRVAYVPVRTTRGPAGARNAGWREAVGEVIAFTDDDTIPHPDWLGEGCRAMAPGVAAAAGRVRVPLPRGPLTDYERDIARMADAEFVTASCFVSHATLAEIGGFDPTFTAAWREDSDLQFTLLERKGRVVRAPRAVVDHPVRPMTWQERVGAHRKILFDALLYKKHPRLYRERIRSSPPWLYYAIVAAILVGVLGLLALQPRWALGGFVAWALLTAAFCVRRLRGGSLAPAHVAEIVMSSVAIPVVAVFWRLVGAWRFRVRFL